MSKQRKPKKRQKKSSNKDATIKKIILITAILQLIQTAVEIVKSIIEIFR